MASQDRRQGDLNDTIQHSLTEQGRGQGDFSLKACALYVPAEGGRLTLYTLPAFLPLGGITVTGVLYCAAQTQLQVASLRQVTLEAQHRKACRIKPATEFLSAQRLRHMDTHSPSREARSGTTDMYKALRRTVSCHLGPIAAQHSTQ